MHIDISTENICFVSNKRNHDLNIKNLIDNVRQQSTHCDVNLTFWID